MEGGELPVGGVEGLGVRVADAGDDVPVVARAAQPQRRPWSDDVKAADGVEVVSEREQVALVGAAAVVEDEQAGRISLGWPLPVGEGGRGSYAAKRRRAG